MRNDGFLSFEGRLKLIEDLFKLPEAQFKAIVFALNPPSGILPSDLSALGDRAFALLQWAEGTGPGLIVLQAALNQILLNDSATLFEKSDLLHPYPEQVFAFDVVKVNEEGTLNVCKQKTSEYFQQNLGRNVYLNLVRIPEGRFWMGSPEDELDRLNVEGPQHKVSVSAFWMSQFPITQMQWRAVSFLDDVGQELKPNPSYFKGDNRPVEQVSWYEAVEFCARLSKYTGKEYRLPSEAEWEYACRAGTTTPFYFGSTITSDLANYQSSYTYGYELKGKYQKQTMDVGSFPPNFFGLYDMHGNIREWCHDYWHISYHGAPFDGSAWTDKGNSSERIVRGGSWNVSSWICRSAYRYCFESNTNKFDLGFRVCCSTYSGS